MSATADPYRPFRPRAARIVSLVFGVVFLVGMSALAWALPSQRAGWGDRLGFLAFGLAVAWFLYRQAAVRAIPDSSGPTVRNLVITTRVNWAQIVSVRFGPDRPWVQLDLADGDTLSVMGVQRADGERAHAEARRLAALVARHSVTARDD
jgi:hypothetical protein